MCVCVFVSQIASEQPTDEKTESKSSEAAKKCVEPYRLNVCVCIYKEQIVAAGKTSLTFKSFDFRVMAIKWNEIAFAIVGADYLWFIFIAHSFILHHCADVIYLFRLLFYYKLFELLHTLPHTQRIHTYTHTHIAISFLDYNKLVNFLHFIFAFYPSKKRRRSRKLRRILFSSFLFFSSSFGRYFFHRLLGISSDSVI